MTSTTERRTARPAARSRRPPSPRPTRRCSRWSTASTAVLERSDLGELEVASGGTTIVLRAPSAVERLCAPARPPPRPAQTSAVAPPADGQARQAGAAAGTASQAPAKPAVTAPADRDLLRRAVAGRDAVRAPSATTSSVGQIIGLIEAMKLFNEIKSDLAGRVTRLCVDDRRAGQGQAGPDRGGARMTGTSGHGRPPHRLGPLRALAGPDQRRPRADGGHLRRVDRQPDGHPGAPGRRRERDDRVHGRRGGAARDPDGRPRARTTST